MLLETEYNTIQAGGNMSEKELQGLIGESATQDVHEMGGVISVVLSSAINKVVLGKLTPEEGLEVFNWGVQKEAEIESETPSDVWEEVKRDSMRGQLLRERGQGWFKELVNEEVRGLGGNTLY